MSKKIISAILVMAMVISMSATALLSSVGAAAETDYEADRTTLKDSIKNLVTYGPTLADDTYDYLVATGILSVNNDLKCTTCGNVVELHARHEFWKNYTTETLAIEDFLFVKTGADRTAAIASMEATIKEAAAAYYFGKEANDGLVDPSFNEGRNAIVKEAAKAINGIFDALKAEVGANGAKPAGYAALYMGSDYKNFATNAKSYNQSIGFNPYLDIITEADYTNDSYWGNALGQYTVRWYTFAEAREINAEGVFAFEKAIREIAIADGAKVLFWDFIAGAYGDFNKIVDDLYASLIGDIKQYFVYEDIDEQIKAFYELEIIIDLYDLYIKDVYNNIYTASAAELLNDVLYAKRVIDFVRNNDNRNTQFYALALTDFATLTNDVLAGIKAVAPRSEQLLKAADITDGTALVRKAEALLANWANWKGQDNAYGAAYSELTTAKNNLKNMIPNAEGTSVFVIVEAGTYGNLKNVAGTEIKNDKVVVEFTPNWFSFVKFSAILEKEIKEFTDAITNKDTTLGAIDLGKNDLGALASILNKYAFLAGIVGDVVEVKDNKIVAKAFNANASAIYASYLFESDVFEDCAAATNANDFIIAILATPGNDVGGSNDLVKSFYEMIVGTKIGNNVEDNNVDQDMALENAYYFVDLYEEILRYALANNFASSGSFDWTKEEGAWEFKSETSDKIKELEAAIKNLSKDLTTTIQTYAWILKNIADLMDWDLRSYSKDNQFWADGIFASDNKVDGKVNVTESVIAGLIEALTVEIDADDFKVDVDDISINLDEVTATVELSVVSALLKDLTGTNGLYSIVDKYLDNNQATEGIGNIKHRVLGDIEDIAEDVASIEEAINDTIALILEDTIANAEGDATVAAQAIVEAINADIEAKLAETVDEINDNIASVVSELRFYTVDMAVQVTAPCYTNSDNYPKDYMKNTVADAEALAKYLADEMAKWNSDKKAGVNVAVNTNITNLVAAYDKFVETFKANILTEAGIAKFDKFVDDTYYVAKAVLGESTDWNNYEKLLTKLENGNVTLNNYFADAKNCYQYFALTLKHVASCNNYFTNLYNKASGALKANLVDKLASLVEEKNLVDYTRDFAADFQAKREIAAYVYAVVSGNEIASDMPVWFAERVLAETTAAWNEKDNYTTKKLVEYKAGLEALLIEADGLNVYNYVSNTDEAKAIWADFVDAYTNAQYIALDTRVEFAKVDEAVAALTAAMAELEKIEVAEGASSVDTLNAKIAAAEALLARADVVDMAEEAELVLAINAAKKALQFNISVLNSTDLDELIKSLNDLMVVIEKEMYTGADLKKAAKVLELQVVVDLYTEASYRKFANALEAAYAMAEEDTATESAMMAAAANVEARFGDLKLAPVEEEPEVVEPEVSVVMTEAIEIYNNAANGYDKAVEGCTAESAAAYNAAINTLKADIEANANDAKLLESIIALNLAKAALTVDVPETCDC